MRTYELFIIGFFFGARAHSFSTLPLWRVGIIVIGVVMYLESVKESRRES